ncbi:DUF4328 domain-containing protein [Thermocrispum agreste]|uniref:DUF4328 domain-containing protein n=1 Tax=Thermocrispum agreste TaxID=37925 RepID=UPI0003FC7B64|nr:DUF4328 domain-containing protein [Thermocrispum agreste]
MTVDPARGFPVRWTASPPPGTPRCRREPPEPPYAGPPSYPVPPRWGFPGLIWRQPTSVPGTRSARPRADELIRPVGVWTAGVLAAAAVFAVLAGVAEFWRYALLVISRDEALGTVAVRVSDGLVTGLWYPIPILLFAALVLGLWWLQLARSEAARLADVEPPYGPVMAGAKLVGLWVLLAVVAAVEYRVELPPLVVVIAAPLLIAVVAVAAVVLPGPVIAELEHVALRKPADERPRPSRLVVTWWVGCVVNAVLVAATLWRRMGDGVQAMADSVLLTGITHLTAAALAVVTILVIRRIGMLLAPERSLAGKRMLVVAVGEDAQPPPLRTVRPAGVRR